ncbi:MAG: FMN-binding negative transcriptional regulator [Actinomycetota bacterium]|jgi:transcriptional regulator|nr:FMN-binding negative transcriptional regulator [Actinomycetota bacterium]
MYVAPVDAGLDDEEWRAFVHDQGFGHLVAGGRGRDVPVVVPTQFLLDGDEIVCHLVARNPVLDAIAEHPRVLMSVAGDWAYIPSTWKVIASEDPRAGIPTTYYAAVQLTGTADVRSDPDEVAGILRRQLAALQPGVDIADPLLAHPRELGTIRGVRIAVEEVRAKFKYGGNVDAAHREAVADRLVLRGRPGDAAAAGHTRRRLEAERGRRSGNGTTLPP